MHLVCALTIGPSTWTALPIAREASPFARRGWAVNVDGSPDHTRSVTIRTARLGRQRGRLSRSHAKRHHSHGEAGPSTWTALPITREASPFARRGWATRARRR